MTADGPAEGITTTFIQNLLNKTREVASKLGLNQDRLPPWLRAADVDIAHINNTSIFEISVSAEAPDSIQFHPDAQSDSALFLGIDEADLRKHVLTFKREDILEGDHEPFRYYGTMTEEGKSVISIEATDSCLFDINNLSYHRPTFLHNIYLQIQPEDQVIATAFLPLAIYIHDWEFQNHADELLKKCIKHLSADLKNYYEPHLGDYYEEQVTNQESFVSRIEDTAIVFGAFDDGPREKELEEVRDYLNTKGYRAQLIKYLPGHPARSIRHKSMMFAMSAKVCVIVDIDAAGHLIEYADLADTEVPVALLRMKDRGSTWMIGPKHRERDDIELFEFENTPLEVLDDVTVWIDKFTEERKKRMSEYYPGWKN